MQRLTWPDDESIPVRIEIVETLRQTQGEWVIVHKAGSAGLTAKKLSRVQKNMLIRMLYISTAVGPITTAVTGTILRTAQAHNAANGITGVLCQGQGVYLQVLEGERSQVDALYARIAQDKRHQNVVLYRQEDITRRYGKWAMAHIDLAHADVADRQQPLFDPYTATLEQVMAKMDELIASGKVMNAPVV